MPYSLNKINIRQGDITTLAVDAIVNAANNSLLGGGGVDGAIHRAAGPELLAECRTLNGCPTGEARLTRGYNLPSRYVIHTVGPVYSGSPSDRHLLQSCYEKCLRIAMDNRLATIAFPAISCGVYGYPIEEAAAIAIDTTTRYLDKTDLLKLVIFVLFSRHDFDIYSNLLKARSASQVPKHSDWRGMQNRSRYLDVPPASFQSFGGEKVFFGQRHPTYSCFNKYVPSDGWCKLRRVTANSRSPISSNEAISDKLLTNNSLRLKAYCFWLEGILYQRLFASSSGCLTLFAGAVLKRYSDKRYIWQKHVGYLCFLLTKRASVNSFSTTLITIRTLCGSGGYHVRSYCGSN